MKLRIEHLPSKSIILAATKWCEHTFVFEILLNGMKRHFSEKIGESLLQNIYLE